MTREEGEDNAMGYAGAEEAISLQPDLRRVATTWKDLPDEVKAKVMALVEAHMPNE